MKSVKAALILLVVATQVAVAQTKQTEVALDDGAQLLFVHPAAWQADISGPRANPTLRLSPAGGDGFRVLITAIPNLKPLSSEELKESIRQKGADLLPTSTQTAVELVRVAGAEATGYLFHLTDRQPEKGPGDYKELREGGVVVGPYVLSVTVLSHPGDSEPVSSALEMLKNVTYKGPAKP